MENKQQIICSSKKHKANAVSYCQFCKKYFCNKCLNHHSEINEDHILTSIDKDFKEVFVDVCKNEGHNDKLEFFCKSHNTLCCVACLCKIKIKNYGQHSDCDFCYINDIVNEKKSKLKENIKILEDLSVKYKESINELKKIYEVINEDKEKLKLQIQKIFTKIRNAVSEKEDKLLLEIDEKFNKLFFKEDIIKEAEKLPNKIKISLEKGKLVDEEWNDNNLNIFINDCINIENNIIRINELDNVINNNHLNKNIKIVFSQEEKQINKLLDTIKTFGEIMVEEEPLNDALYNDFDIQYKNPIHTLNKHTNYVFCLTLMKDRRLVSGSYDSSIIIYNKESYKPELKIKEHKDWVLCIIQLSTGILASCSKDKTIILFNINGVNYQIIQTLMNHNDSIRKIIELKNKTLVSCSKDASIIFYKKDNMEYKKDYSFSTDEECTSVIQITNNEICYSTKNKICFYDILEKKKESEISNIITDLTNGNRVWLTMLSKELLLVPGEKQMSIVNINDHKLVRVIKVPDSNNIYGICMLKKNMILTGDSNKALKQWKIEGDNLTLISTKKNAHNDRINVLLNLGDGHIASGADDKLIKIW